MFLLGFYTHVVCKAHEWHDIAETYMRARNFYCIWDVWCTAEGSFLQNSPPARDRRAQRPQTESNRGQVSVLLPQNDLCSTTTENIDLLRSIIWKSNYLQSLDASLKDRPIFECSASFVTTMMQFAWYHRQKTSQAEWGAERKYPYARLVHLCSWAYGIAIDCVFFCEYRCRNFDRMEIPWVHRDHALGSNVRFIHASMQLLLTVRPLQMLRYLNAPVGDYLIVHRRWYMIRDHPTWVPSHFHIDSPDSGTSQSFLFSSHQSTCLLLLCNTITDVDQETVTDVTKCDDNVTEVWRYCAGHIPYTDIGPLRQLNFQNNFFKWIKGIFMTYIYIDFPKSPCHILKYSRLHIFLVKVIHIWFSDSIMFMKADVLMCQLVENDSIANVRGQFILLTAILGPKGGLWS